MGWKLLAGRLYDAWREYPEARRAVLRVPSGRPILLTGTHRSGTTWFAKMLAASGIWYVHEPFNPNKGRWPQAFTYCPASGRAERVDALMSDVLSGGFRAALQLPNADHPLMPLRLLRPSFRRAMVKDPLACLLTAYLTQRFDMQTLILFRHPAGFVASVCRLGWPKAEFLRQFLADDALMADHLEPYRTILQKHSGEDGVESAAVLHAALNTVLWRFVEQGVGRAIIFEKISANPIGEFERIFEELDLPYGASVREAHERLCHGKVRQVSEYHPHAVARNSRAMSDAWRKQLSQDDISKVRRVWERFPVPLYRDAADWGIDASIDSGLGEGA